MSSSLSGAENRVRLFFEKLFEGVFPPDYRILSQTPQSKNVNRPE